MKCWLLIVLSAFAAGSFAFAAEITNSTAVVMFQGRELFEVTNISSLPADQRVDILTRRIRD